MNEAKQTQIKRKYTDSYPAHKSQMKTPVRNKVLGFIKEKVNVSHKEILEFLSQFNEAEGRSTTIAWVKKNSGRYIKVTEKKGEKSYSLTRLGKRVLERTKIEEDGEAATVDNTPGMGNSLAATADSEGSGDKLNDCDDSIEECDENESLIPTYESWKSNKPAEPTLFEKHTDGDFDINPEHTYGVFRVGGSIGDNGRKRKVVTRYFKGSTPGFLIKTFPDGADAKAFAKQRRGTLTKGEKSYYGMNYYVAKLNPKDIKMITLSMNESMFSINPLKDVDGFAQKIAKLARAKKIEKEFDNLIKLELTKAGFDSDSSTVSKVANLVVKIIN